MTPPLPKEHLQRFHDLKRQDEEIDLKLLQATTRMKLLKESLAKAQDRSVVLQRELSITNDLLRTSETSKKTVVESYKHLVDSNKLLEKELKSSEMRYEEAWQKKTDQSNAFKEKLNEARKKFENSVQNMWSKVPGFDDFMQNQARLQELRDRLEKKKKENADSVVASKAIKEKLEALQRDKLKLESYKDQLLTLNEQKAKLERTKTDLLQRKEKWQPVKESNQDDEVEEEDQNSEAVSDQEETGEANTSMNLTLFPMAEEDETAMKQFGFSKTRISELLKGTANPSSLASKKRTLFENRGPLADSTPKASVGKLSNILGRKLTLVTDITPIMPRPLLITTSVSSRGDITKGKSVPTPAKPHVLKRMESKALVSGQPLFKMPHTKQQLSLFPKLHTVSESRHVADESTNEQQHEKCTETSISSFEQIETRKEDMSSKTNELGEDAEDNMSCFDQSEAYKAGVSSKTNEHGEDAEDNMSCFDQSETYKAGMTNETDAQQNEQDQGDMSCFDRNEARKEGVNESPSVSHHADKGQASDAERLEEEEEGPRPKVRKMNASEEFFPFGNVAGGSSNFFAGGNNAFSSLFDSETQEEPDNSQDNDTGNEFTFSFGGDFGKGFSSGFGGFSF